MLVSDLLRILKLRDAGNLSEAERQVLHDFFTILERHGDMDISAFFDLFKPKRRLTTGGTSRRRIDRLPPAPPPTVGEVVEVLETAFDDDKAFEKKLEEFASIKGVTKPMLKEVFKTLFDRTGGVSSKATRDELVRLIGDERNIIVRDKKAAAMLGRRPVTAE